MKIKSQYVPGMVTGAAFLASAQHIVSVVDETNPILISLVYPLGIDGLIYVGVEAMQKRRRVVGSLAILVGAAYSMMFNQDAEKAWQMPAWLVASSMPVCLFVSLVIAYTGKSESEPVVQEIERIVYRAPELLPIVPPVTRPTAPARPAWVRPDGRRTLCIVPSRPSLRVVAAERPRPVKITERTDGRKSDGRGRNVAWDVDEAVRQVMDGIAVADVAASIGVDAKQVQRTKRTVLLLSEDASRTDEEIASMVNGVSARFVARVRAAREGK